MQLLANTASRAAVRPAGVARRVVAVPARPARFVVPRASSGGSGVDAEELKEKAAEIASQLKVRGANGGSWRSGRAGMRSARRGARGGGWRALADGQGRPQLSLPGDRHRR
jgi:hypothetical protein